MKRTMRASMVMAVLMVGAVAGSRPAAAETDPWRLRLGAVAAESTADSQIDASYGFGLGLEYRLSPRLGLELGTLTTEPKSKEEFQFEDETVRLEARFRMTPVMAKLDLHLTPDSRVDLYVAPTAAYVRMSDLTVRVSAEDEGQVFSVEQQIDTDDKLAWGLSLGLDVPLGSGGSFLSLAATYLRLPLSVRDDEGFSSDDGFSTDNDIDPLFVQIGYGLRF
jgi:outer membrane protein W